MKIKNILRVPSFYFLLLFIFLIYFRLFLSSVLVANDLHFTYAEELKERFNLPLTWGTAGAVGLGEYAVSVLWNWPVNFVFGVFANSGFSYDLLIRLLGFLPIFLLGFLGITKLFNYLKIEGWGKWIGTFFYLTNTYILLLVDGGQLNLAMAYSLLPLAFVFYKKSFESTNFKDLLKFVVSVIAISIYDIRIVYFVIIIIALDFFYKIYINRESFISSLKSIIKIVVPTIVILLGFHAFWFFTAVLSRVPSLPSTYTRESQIGFLSFAELKHSITLLSPHWYKNVFGKVDTFRREFLIIPILVFLAPFLKRRDKSLYFWVMVALIGVFLTKGGNIPFPRVYTWLFTIVPGFSLFRDPTKFFFLVALSYSVLIAITVEALTKKIGKIIPVLFITYLLLLISPVYTGKMTGTFARPIYEKEYFGLAKTLKEDKQFGRVFWIPTKAPLGYSSPTHPSVEAFRLLEKRPFSTAVIGTYELFNYLRQPYMGELFDIAGIGYIVYPYPDTRREELKQDNIEYYHWFLDKIANFGWTGPTQIDSQIPIIETREHQDKFFISQNTFFVVGSDDLYSKFDLSENVLIYVEQSPGLMNRIGEFKNSKVFLNNKEEIDLAASLIDPDKFIFPAEQLDFEPNSKGWPASRSFSVGWWKREATDLVWWRNFLHQEYELENLDFDYGGGWSIAEGDTKFEIRNSKFEIDKILLARVMRSSRGGKIEFWQEDKFVGTINTKMEDHEKTTLTLDETSFEYDRANFGWSEIGELPLSSDKLTVKASGEINVVNALVIIEKSEWQNLKNKTASLLKQRDLNNFNEPKNQNEIKVSYEMVNPTYYKVKVEGLEKPSTLVFSMNYDPLWEMNGVKSTPVYSFLNGFPVNYEGTYDVIFSAQKYVYPGLIVSGLTLLVSSIILFNGSKPQRYFKNRHF